MVSLLCLRTPCVASTASSAHRAARLNGMSLARASFVTQADAIAATDAAAVLRVKAEELQTFVVEGSLR